MDQRHRHSTLSHRGGAPLDRATTRVASCEYARQARLQEERLTRTFSPGVLIEHDVPHRRLPWVNYALILVNCLVFYHQLTYAVRGKSRLAEQDVL